jgi:hypothetical protein
LKGLALIEQRQCWHACWQSDASCVNHMCRCIATRRRMPARELQCVALQPSLSK